MDDKNKNTDLKEQGWPNTVTTRDELDSALEAGEKSGVSKRSFDEIVNSAIARVKNG